MDNQHLSITRHPQLQRPSMFLGFSGWMDGGEVSTGTVGFFAKETRADVLGEIIPDDFYVYNVPGSMEISAMFRPHAKIENGLVVELNEPTNTFFYSEEKNTILLQGKEPQLQWRRYANALFDVAEAHDVSRICFLGSVASMVPHTREPLFYSSFTRDDQRDKVEAIGMTPTYYEGPSSFSSFLITIARERGFEMYSIVAGIPPYVQGRNVKCIESVARKAASLLSLDIDFTSLYAEIKTFEDEINKVVEQRPDLAEQIRKLEAVYDEQVGERKVSDSGLGNEDTTDLRDWFDGQGFKFD
ncbi:MAG: hypothetical protein COA73_01190 [Candidatus Hydrogenedentota bacterium]|nr:MAG: hypothetical protein COA73_01190 [Candidatus Hydrogenedentota bacterium]